MGNHWSLSQAETHPKRSSDIRTFSVLASASSTSLTTSLSFPSAYPRQLLSSCEYKPSREILLFHSRCNKTRQKSSLCFVHRYSSNLKTPDTNVLVCYGETQNSRGPSKLILRNNQQMQLYAVNFIPLLGSLYMFRVFYTPIIRSTIFNCVYSHWYKP